MYIYVCVCVCVCIHTHNGIPLLHSAIKWWDLGICNSVDRTWGYHVKWSKSDREKQTLYNFTPMWNIKNFKNKRINQTKPKQTHRYREQINGYQREVGGGRVKWLKKCNCMVTEKLHFRWWACCMGIQKSKYNVVHMKFISQFSHSVMSNSLWPHGLLHEIYIIL